MKMISHCFDEAEIVMSQDIITDFCNRLIDIVDKDVDTEKRKVILDFLLTRCTKEEKQEVSPSSSPKDIRELVLKELSSETPSKAPAIAKKLSLDKTAVNSMIYKLKSEGLVTGDGSSGWILSK